MTKAKSMIYPAVCAALMSAFMLGGCGTARTHNPPAIIESGETNRTVITEESHETAEPAETIKAGSPESAEHAESAETTGPEDPAGIPASAKVDFDGLQALNPDIYAWIEIPGTVISYPVVQADGDNTYYLKRAYDRSYSAAGAIFTEDYNSKDFTDRNTVIYGHYMKDGTLFSGLHKFIDAEFFSEHRYVYIHTPDGILSYKIFAVYPYDTRHLLMSFDYSNPYVFGRVFEAVFGIRDINACIAGDVTLDSENNRVLTLSTCLYGEPSERLLLQAVLTE